MTLEVNGGREPGLQVTEDAPSLQKLKIEGYFTRAELTRDILLELQAECRIKNSKKIAEILYREIKEASLKKRRSVSFVRDIYKKLLVLNDFHQEIKEKKKRFPFSKILVKVVVEYIQLEHNVLYASKRNHLESEKEVEGRIINLIENMFLPYDKKPTPAHCTNPNSLFVLKVLYAVASEYRTDNNLFGNLVRKLLKKLDLWDTVKRSTMGCCNITTSNPAVKMLSLYDINELPEEYDTDDEDPLSINCDLSKLSLLTPVEKCSTSSLSNQQSTSLLDNSLDVKKTSVNPVNDVETICLDDSDEDMVVLDNNECSAKTYNSDLNKSVKSDVQINLKSSVKLEAMQSTKTKPSDYLSKAKGNKAKSKSSKSVVNKDGFKQSRQYDLMDLPPSTSRCSNITLKNGTVVKIKSEHQIQIVIEEDEDAILNKYIEEEPKIDVPIPQDQPQDIAKRVRHKETKKPIASDNQVNEISSSEIFDIDNNCESIRQDSDFSVHSVEITSTTTTYPCYQKHELNNVSRVSESINSETPDLSSIDQVHTSSLVLRKSYEKYYDSADSCLTPSNVSTNYEEKDNLENFTPNVEKVHNATKTYDKNNDGSVDSNTNNVQNSVFQREHPPIGTLAKTGSIMEEFLKDDDFRKSILDVLNTIIDHVEIANNEEVQNSTEVVNQDCKQGNNKDTGVVAPLTIQSFEEHFQENSTTENVTLVNPLNLSDKTLVKCSKLENGSIHDQSDQSNNTICLEKSLTQIEEELVQDDKENYTNKIGSYCSDKIRINDEIMKQKSEDSYLDVLEEKNEESENPVDNGISISKYESIHKCMVGVKTREGNNYETKISLEHPVSVDKDKSFCESFLEDKVESSKKIHIDTNEEIPKILVCDAPDKYQEENIENYTYEGQTPLENLSSINKNEFEYTASKDISKNVNEETPKIDQLLCETSSVSKISNCSDVAEHEVRKENTSKYMVENKNVQESNCQHQIILNVSLSDNNHCDSETCKADNSCSDVLKQNANDKTPDDTSDVADKNGDYYQLNTIETDNSHADILTEEINEKVLGDATSDSVEENENQCTSETRETDISDKHVLEIKNLREIKHQHEIVSNTFDILNQGVNEEIFHDITSDEVDKNGDYCSSDAADIDNSHSDILMQERISYSKDKNENHCTSETSGATNILSATLQQEITEEILDDVTADSVCKIEGNFNLEISKSDDSHSDILRQETMKGICDNTLGSVDKDGNLNSITRKPGNSQSDISMQEINEKTIDDSKSESIEKNGKEQEVTQEIFNGATVDSADNNGWPLDTETSKADHSRSNILIQKMTTEILDDSTGSADKSGHLSSFTTSKADNSYADILEQEPNQGTLCDPTGNNEFKKDKSFHDNAGNSDCKLHVLEEKIPEDTLHNVLPTTENEVHIEDLPLGEVKEDESLLSENCSPILKDNKIQDIDLDVISQKNQTRINDFTKSEQQAHEKDIEVVSEKLPSSKQTSLVEEGDAVAPDIFERDNTIVPNIDTSISAILNQGDKGNSENFLIHTLVLPENNVDIETEMQELLTDNESNLVENEKEGNCKILDGKSSTIQRKNCEEENNVTDLSSFNKSGAMTNEILEQIQDIENTITFTAKVPEQQIQNDDSQLENMSTSTFSDLAEGKHNNEGNLSKIPKDSLPENQRPIDSEEESLNENTNFKDLEITMEYNNHVGVDKTEKSELIPLTNSVENEEYIKTVEEDKGNLNTVEHKFCEKDNNDILNLQPSNEIKQKDNQVMPNKEVVKMIQSSSQDEKNKFNEECNNAISVEAKSNIQRDYDVQLMPIEDDTTLSKCTTKDVELSSTTDYESHTLVIEEPITSVSTFAYYQSTENYHFAASQLLSEKNTLDHNKTTSLEHSEPDLEKVIGEIGGVAQPTCCSITYSIPDDGGDFDAPVQIRIEELPNKEMYSHSEQLVSEDLKITEVENVHERCLSIDNGLNVLAGTASECQYLPVLHENNKKKGITNKQARSGLIITNKHSFVHRKNFLHKTISRNRINYKPNEFKGVVGKQSPHRVYDATYNIGQQLSSSDDSCDSFKDNLVIAEEVTKNDLNKSFDQESLEDVILIETPTAQKGVKLGKPAKASKSKNVQDKLSNKSKKEKKPKNVTFNDEIVTIGRCTRSKGMPLFIDTESTLKNKKNKNAECLVNVLTSNNTLLTSGPKSRSIKGKSILKDTISTQPKSQRKKDALKKDKSVPPIIENKPTTDYSIENILHMSYNLRNGLTIERIDCPTSTVHNNVPLNLSKKAMLNPEVSIEIINDKSQKMMDLKVENTASTKSRRSINKRKPKQTKSIEDVNKFDVNSTLESTKCETIEKIEPTTNRGEKMGQDKIKIWQPFEDVKEDTPNLNDHIQQTIVNNLVDKNVEHSDTIMTDVSQNEIMSNVTEIAPINKYGNSPQKRTLKKQAKSIKERKCKKRNFLRSMKETHDVSHKQGLLEICLTKKTLLVEKLDESDHIKKATNMEVSKNDKEQSEVEVVESEGIRKTKATQRQKRTSRNNKNNDLLQNGLTSKETVTSLAENIVEACKIKDTSSANAIKDIDVRDKKHSRKSKRNKLIDDLAEDNSQEKATFLKNYELMGKVTIKDKKQGRTTRRSSLENMVSQCSASIAPHETSKNLTSYEKEKSKEFTDHKQSFTKTADNFSDNSKVLTRNTSKQRINDKYLQKLRSSKQNMVRSKIGSKHFKRNQKKMVTIGNLDIPKKSKNVNKQNDEMKSNIPLQMTDVLNVDSEHLKINATTVNSETTAACCQNNIQPENNTETLDDEMKCNIVFKTTAALKVDSENFEINTATMNERITIDCCQNNIQQENNTEIPDDEMKSNTAFEMRDVLKIHSKDLKINATTMNQEITVDFCQNNIQPESNPETKSTIIFKTTDVLKVDSEDIEEYTTAVNKVAIQCPQNNIQPENNTETPDIESEESKDNHQTVESNGKTNLVSVKVASGEDEIHTSKEISELCEESTRLKENASASTEEGSTKSLIKVEMQAHVESVQTDDVLTEDTFISEKHPKESQVKNNTDDIEKHDVTEKAVPDVQTEEVLHEKYIPVLSTTEDCQENEVDISESISLPIESNNEVQREENIARKDLTGKADNIDIPKEQNTAINQEKIVPMEDEVNFYKEGYENQTENALIHADSDTELITDGNAITDEENKLKDTLLHVKEDTELNEQSNTITNIEDRQDDTLSCEEPGVMSYEEESIHILQEYTSDVSIPANNNNEKLYKEKNVIVDQQSKLEVTTQVLEDDTGTDFPTVHDYATEKLRKSAFLGELGIYEKPNVCLNVELYNVSKDNTMITTVSDEVEESTVENVKLTEDTEVIVPNDETKAEIENNSKILPTQSIITGIKVLKSLQINEDIFNHDESSLISEQKPIKSDKASNIESLSDQINPTSLSKNNPLTIEVKLPVLDKDNTPNLAVNASYHRDTPEANPELIGKRKQMDEIVNNNEENCKKSKWLINESVVANIPENITHMFNLKPVVKIRKIHDLSAYRDRYVQSLRKNTEEKAKDKSRSIRSKGKNLDAIVDKLVTSLKTNEKWKQFRFQSQTNSDVSTLTATESVAVSSNSNSDVNVHSYCEETFNKSSMEVALEKNEKVKDQEELKDNDNVDEIGKPKINAIEEELKKSTVQNEVPIGGQINKADTEIQLEETVNTNLLGESVGNLFSNENTDTSIELETVNNKQIQEEINNSKDDISKEGKLDNITKKDEFSEKVERMEVSEVTEVYSPKDQIRLNEDDSVVEEDLLHTDEKLQLESNNSEDIELTTVSEEEEATELFSEQVNKSFSDDQQQCKEVKAPISLINTHNDKQTEQLYHLDEPPDAIQLHSQCNIIEENALLSKHSQEETVYASCEDVSEEKENNIGTQSKELLTNIPVDDNAGVQSERNLTDQLGMKTSPENYNQLNVDQLCYDNSKETFNSEHSFTYESTSVELECNGQDLLTVSVEHSKGTSDVPNCAEEAVNNVHNEGKLSNIISLESPSQVNEIPSNNQCKAITQEMSVCSNSSQESPLIYSKQLPEQVEDSMSNESFDSNESTLKVRPAKELLEKYKFMQDESYDVSNTECDLVTNSPAYHISTETVESAKDRPESSSIIEPICNNILETASMESVEKETHIEENILFDSSSKEPYQIAEEVIDEGTTDGDINTEQGAQTSYEGTNVMADNLASFSTKNPQKLQNIILDYNNQPMSHSILNVSFDADQFLSDVMLDKRLPYLESCSELLENTHPPNVDIHNPQTKVIRDEQEVVLSTDVAANIEKKSNVEVPETGSEVNINNSNGFNDALGCNETIDVDDPQLAEKVKSMGFVKIGSESSDHDYINYGGPLLVGTYEQPHNNESPEMSPSRQVSIGAHTENAMVPVSSHEALVSNVAEQYNSLAYNFMDTQDYNFINKMMANVMHHQTSIADTSNQFDNTITFSNDNLLSSTRIDDTNGPDFTINSFPLSDLALCDIEDFYPSETISPEKIIVNPLKTLHTIPKSVIDSPQKVTVKVNEYEFASTDNLFKDDAFICPTTPKLNTSDSLIECDKKSKEREVIKIKVKTKAEKKMIALTEAFPIRRNTRTPVSAPRLPKRKLDTVEAKNEVVKTSKDNGETNSIHKGDQQKRKSESSSLNHELTPEIVSDKSPEKRSVPITKQSFLESLSTSFESQEELEMKPDKLAKLIFATFDDTDLLNVDSPNILESPTRVTVKINEYEYASTDDLYSRSCKKAKKDSISDKKVEDTEKQKPVAKKLEFSSPKKHENSNATLKTPENVNDNKIEQVSEQESSTSTKEDGKQKDSLDKVIDQHSNDSHSSMSSKVDEKIVDDTKVEIKNKKSECKNEDLKKQESLKEADTKVVQKEDLKIQKNVEKVKENQLKVKETVPTHIKIPKIQPEQNKSKGKPEDDKVLRTSKEIPAPEAPQEKSTLLSTTIPLQKYQSEVQRWRPDIPNQYNQKVKSGSNNSQYSRPAYSGNQRSESKNAARPPTYVRKEDSSKPNDKSNYNSGTSKNYYQSSSNNHLAQPYYVRQDAWKYDRPPSRSDQRKSTYGRSERTNMQEPSKSSSRNPSSNDKSYWDHKNSSRHQSRSERITANDYQKQNDQRSSTSCYSRIPQCRSERNMEVQYPQLDNTAFSRNKYDDIKRRSYEKSLRNQVNNTHERYHQLLTTSKPSERQKRKSPPMEHNGSSKMRKFEEERKEVQQRKRGSSPSDEVARKRQKDYDEIFSKLREEGNINKNFKLKYPMQTPSSVNCSGISQSSSDNWFEKFPEQFSLKEARYVTFGGLTRRSEKHS